MRGVEWIVMLEIGRYGKKEVLAGAGAEEVPEAIAAEREVDTSERSGSKTFMMLLIRGI